MQIVALLTALMFSAPIDCKDCGSAKQATVTKTVYVARPLTFLERLRERRLQRLAALQERSFARPLLGLRLFGGCCR